MKNIISVFIVLFSFLIPEAQVILSTNFADDNYKKAPIHDVWKVANDISPSYKGQEDSRQIRADMKMNIIRLSGGIKNKDQQNTSYDMVKWDEEVNNYVYDFSRLINVINKADEHNDHIYQLVIDNVPWCFQRGFTFVDLDKNSFDGEHFRKFEQVEQYGNGLPPSDMGAYGKYVEALVETLVKNFGKDRVKNWRFRIGSEIESPGHWKGTAEDFVAYLDVSLRAIRNIIPDAHVGIHTREPHYEAIKHKGLNYKGKKFVSFHDEILHHCHKNDLHLNSWGLSYYIQFDKEGEFYANENWYKDRVAPLVNHPRWNKDTEINLEEFKATASFKGPDGSKVTLKSGSSHGEVAHISMSHLFYKHAELNQIHRWLQYKDVKDDIANQELLSMVGKRRYKTISNGIPKNVSDQIDAIFVKDDKLNGYEVLLYNYNGLSTKYGSEQPVIISFISELPVGTKLEYRSSYYTKSHNKLQSFEDERFFKDSWYVGNIKESQKLGESSRVLKPQIYNSYYKLYNGHKVYAPSDWKIITTTKRSDDEKFGSEIVIETSLESFSFRKFEFKLIP